MRTRVAATLIFRAPKPLFNTDLTKQFANYCECLQIAEIRAPITGTTGFRRGCQPGRPGRVRYSLTSPHACFQSNLVGIASFLQGCHHTGVGRLVQANSSSVYHSNTRMPFSDHDSIDQPNQPVRGHQEAQRADGAYPQSSCSVRRPPGCENKFILPASVQGRPRSAKAWDARCCISTDSLLQQVNTDSPATYAGYSSGSCGIESPFWPAALQG